MSAASTNTQETVPPRADWIERAGLADVRAGQMTSRRLVSTDGSDRVRAAMRSALGDIESPLGIADICPDPLVFALASGLPRLTGFGQSIDGGSTWCDHAPIGDGPLYAVSEVSQIAERTTHDGRRLVRVDYRTRFTDLGGVLVGTATGSSIHIGGAG